MVYSVRRSTNWAILSKKRPHPDDARLNSRKTSSNSRCISRCNSRNGLMSSPRPTVTSNPRPQGIRSRVAILLVDRYRAAPSPKARETRVQKRSSRPHRKNVFLTTAPLIAILCGFITCGAFDSMKSIPAKKDCLAACGNRCRRRFFRANRVGAAPLKIIATVQRAVGNITRARCCRRALRGRSG